MAPLATPMLPAQQKEELGAFVISL